MPSSRTNVAISYTVPQDPEHSGGEPLAVLRKGLFQVRRILHDHGQSENFAAFQWNTFLWLAQGHPLGSNPRLCLGDVDVLRQTPLILVELQLKR